MRPPPLLPLLLAGALLIGCGHGTDVAAGDLDASSQPTRSPHTHTTRSPGPTVSTAPDVSGPLADFPLARGYAAENGDDASPVEITHRPASRRFGVCGRTVWDPRTGTTDLIGVEYRGEAEYVRGRTLVLYPDVRAAEGAVASARAAVAACPDEPDGHGQGTTHTPLPDSFGDQSLVWTDTFYTLDAGERQHDTGLVVYVLVRVGRAVLLGYEYGEGNGSPTSRRHAVARTLHAERALVGPMRELPAARG